MKLKGLHFADVAEIQEAVTNELKNVQKEDFSAAFSETVRPRKSLYICQRNLFWIKKVCFLLVCLRFKKKIRPKTFRPHYVHFMSC